VLGKDRLDPGVLKIVDLGYYVFLRKFKYCPLKRIAECLSHNNGGLDMVCADLWCIDQMNNPEDFVYEILSFELPEDIEPKAFARPGFDPLAQNQ
jgi:hypothetical protein